MKLLAITPQLLHKDSVDDVLIRSVQGVLPAKLTQRQWSDLTQKTSGQEHALLEAAYIADEENHVLRGVPSRISNGEVAELNSFDIDVASFYFLDDDVWHLTAPVLPAGAVRSLYGLGHVAPQLDLDEEQHIQLRMLLATHLTPGLAPTFSYIAHNDTRNYFFYRKMHEHVPGLMLIETARQAFYHYVYSTTGFRRGEVSISMSNLEITFDRYVESAYELEILLTQSNGIARNEPRVIDKTATFYQNGRSVACVRLQGAVMKMPLFKRLRTLSFPESHWFTLSHRVSRKALLTDRVGGVFPVQIAQLSMAGVRLTSPLLDGRCASLSVYVEGSGFVVLPLSGPCTLSSGNHVELRFAALNAQQRYALQEMIKCNGFFHECGSEDIPLKSDVQQAPLRTAEMTT